MLEIFTNFSLIYSWKILVCQLRHYFWGLIRVIKLKFGQDILIHWLLLNFHGSTQWESTMLHRLFQVFCVGIVHSNSSDPEGELSKNQRVFRFLVVALPLETSETKQFLHIPPLVSKIIQMNYNRNWNNRKLK